MEKIKCIYAIKDIRTDKVIYVGMTCDFNQRRSYHFAQNTRPIDKHIFDEGREHFVMEILCHTDELSDNDMLKLEDKLILEYNTIEDGFNKHRSGNIYKDDADGYQREYYREYKKANKWKDYQHEYNREYQQKNKEHLREYQRQYRARKKDERLQQLEQRVSNIEYAIKELDINIETAIAHNGYL